MLAARTISSLHPRPQAVPAVEAISADLLNRELGFSRRRVAAQQALYRAGETLRSVFFIHAGCIKTSLAAADGRERVTGFHLRGELVGLESIGLDSHQGDAIALEDCEIWEIALVDLMAACARNPSFQRALTARMTAQLRSERQWMLDVGTLAAEQRVATLLLDLGERLSAIGFSATHFVLRMTRAEIGSFLNLQLETVTRAITSLRERGLLDVTRRDIRIVDVAGLRAGAGGVVH